MTQSSEPTTQPLSTAKRPPLVARIVYRFSVPIILGWLLLMVVLNAVVPQLEVVAAQNAVPMSPSNAPSMRSTP